MPTTKISLPSVQSVYLEMHFGYVPLASGTGFITNSPRGPVLITNRHNLSGRSSESNQPISKTGGLPDRVIILHNHKDRLGEWIPKTEPLLKEDGTALWYEHPTLGSRADFVALPLTQIEAVQFYPYLLGIGDPDIHIAPSDVVSVVGFPFGLISKTGLAIWATGFMASEPEIDHNELPVFLIDCRARSGQSGSAVIAHRNAGIVTMSDGSSHALSGPSTRFLGIYSGRINDQSDLGIVWKAGAIRELVESIPAQAGNA